MRSIRYSLILTRSEEIIINEKYIINNNKMLKNKQPKYSKWPHRANPCPFEYLNS